MEIPLKARLRFNEVLDGITSGNTWLDYLTPNPGSRARAVGELGERSTPTIRLQLPVYLLLDSHSVESAVGKRAELKQVGQ